jgi:hypothetical protein
MNYAAEMGSGAMIYIQNFIKIGSNIQIFIAVINRHSDSMVMA